MRTIATAAAAACLLLASPSLATSPSSQFEFAAFQALHEGEERELTATANLRVLLFCEVLDEGSRHAVLAHVEVIGPLTGKSAATKPAGEGIAWGRFALELPGEVVFRFVASSDAPFLPDRAALIPGIRVQSGRTEFIQLTPIIVALEAFPNFPCVYRLAVRQRGLAAPGS